LLNFLFLKKNILYQKRRSSEAFSPLTTGSIYSRSPISPDYIKEISDPTALKYLFNLDMAEELDVVNM
jgi:hypothetical protein